jgi:hypothetical protein
MAIEFKHGGRVWRADTPAEAIALRRRLEAEDQQAVEMGEEPDWRTERIWTPDVVMELLQSVGPQQELFLHALYEHPELTSENAIKYLSLDSDLAFAGVLSGLSKQLKKLGLKPWELYSTQVQWKGKGKSRAFCLLGNFRMAAHELGWPENWKTGKAER